MKRVSPIMKAHLIRGALYLLLMLAASLIPFALAQRTTSGPLLALSQHEVPGRVQKTLTLQERVLYQRAIEEVYWRHRIWPKERPDSKPSLDAVISQAQLEKKVRDYLRNSQALEDDWQRPITAEQLQVEMNRMAQHTKQPEVLRELFAALGNDPFVIAECLARPVLTERLFKSAMSPHDPSKAVGQPIKSVKTSRLPSRGYTLPVIATTSKSQGSCNDDWGATSTVNAPSARQFHTAIWTGSEMIVWGGLAMRPLPDSFTRRFGPAVR